MRKATKIIRAGKQAPGANRRGGVKSQTFIWLLTFIPSAKDHWSTLLFKGVKIPNMGLSGKI